MVTPYLIKAQE